MLPTGSAVISDIVDLARNILQGTAGRVPMLSYQADRIGRIPVMPIDSIRTNYYFRFQAVDRPGVLSKIAGILGSREISLKSVHQKGRKTNGSVPIVMLTHKARESNVQKALSLMDGLDILTDKTIMIRVEDR